MTTPDEYRYAKAHLRSAIAELELVKHYLRESPGHTMVVVEDADDDLRAAYVACQDLSQKDFILKAPTP